MSASIEVTAPIAEGSLVVLRDVEFDGDVMPGIAEEMRRIAGHDRFLVLAIAGDGDVEVWGPDDDLRAKLSTLLVEEARRRPEPTPRPGSSSGGGWQGGRGQRPTPPPKA